MPSPQLAHLLNAVANQAQKLGVEALVVAVKDPTTGELIVVTSPKVSADLRAKIVTKLGLAELSDTAWPE